MNDDYLWDGSGEPDPEIQQLESVLSPLRNTKPALQLPATPTRVASRVDLWSLAAAAAVVLGLSAALRWDRASERPASAAPGWKLAWLEDESSQVARQARLEVGQWIDTRAGRVRLSVGEVGEVQLEPATRVGLMDAGRRSQRLALAHGVMHATIWAPPGQFLVDTPSAVAVDFGCRYTLKVDEAGAGLLQVEAGWVGFEHDGLQSLVPAGAACATRRGIGPGTPYSQGAPEALRQALAQLDFGPRGESRDAALGRALAAARASDALSLWHLLSRLDGEDRGRVFDRLALLVPPPPGVARADILRGDRAMRELWWGELGLGSADFWRTWTGRWSDASGPAPPAR